MKHYGILEWVDFVRGLTPEQERAAMREHLGDGCAKCRQASAFCGTLARIAAGMAREQPPDPVAQRAFAICPARDSSMAALPYDNGGIGIGRSPHPARAP